MVTTAAYLSKIELSSDDTNFSLLTDVSCDLNIDPEEIETTTHGDNTGFKEYILGLSGWSFSISGLVKDEITAFNLLEISYFTRPNPDLWIRFYPDKGKNKNYKGKVVVSSFSQTSTLNDAIQFNVTLTGTGALTLIS